MARCVRCDSEISDPSGECDFCKAIALDEALEFDGPATAEPTPAPEPAVLPRPASLVPVGAARPEQSPGTGRTREAAALAVVTGLAAVLTFLWLNARPSARDTVEEMHRPSAAAAPAAVPVKAEVAPAPAGIRWTDANRDRWVSQGRSSIAFELEATRPVPVWMDTVRPLLVVRCEGKRTDAFVYTESAAAIEPEDENHTVQLAFDGEPGVTERWVDSAEHDALFAPDPQSFTRRLVTARTFRFRFQPHNAAPTTAEFEVAGFAELVRPLAQKCGWK